MSGSGPKISQAQPHLRALLALSCIVCVLLALPCAAARPVRVYEVDVEGQSVPAVQEAMRQALVRDRKSVV